jgi:hypothetical protein
MQATSLAAHPSRQRFAPPQEEAEFVARSRCQTAKRLFLLPTKLGFTRVWHCECRSRIDPTSGGEREESQASAARGLVRRRVCLSSLSSPHNGGAERRKTHLSNPHRAQPSVAHLPAQAACVTRIVGEQCRDAHALRRSTAAIFGARDRASGAGLLRSFRLRSSVPRPAIEGSPT